MFSLCCSAPEDAPEGVECLPLSSTGLHVKWRAPPHTTWNGQIRGYRVLYVPFPRQGISLLGNAESLWSLKFFFTQNVFLRFSQKIIIRFANIDALVKNLSNFFQFQREKNTRICKSSENNIFVAIQVTFLSMNITTLYTISIQIRSIFGRDVGHQVFKPLPGLHTTL